MIPIEEMIQAFDDALLGCEKAAIAAFSQGLNKVIHKGTYFKKGDKLRMYWQKSGGVILTCGDKVSDVIYNKELSRRLLEVYVDDARSVSKDLIKCMEDNVHETRAKIWPDLPAYYKGPFGTGVKLFDVEKDIR